MVVIKCDEKFTHSCGPGPNDLGLSRGYSCVGYIGFERHARFSVES
jgi:hypothetical protein